MRPSPTTRSASSCAWIIRSLSGGAAISTMRMGRYRDAIDDYDQSINLKPDNPEALLGRGFCWGQLGDFHRAIQDFDKLLALRPDDAKALTLRGAARFRLDDNAGAIADFTAAMKITPQEVYLYLARAAALVKLERHAEALEDREQAVKLAPESAEVYLARGGSYHQLGSTRRVWPIAARRSNWIRSFPKPGSREAALIICWETTPRRESDMAQALRLRPDYQEAAEVLAKAQKHLEEAKQAEAKNIAPPAAPVAKLGPPGSMPQPAPTPPPAPVPVAIPKPAAPSSKPTGGTEQEHEARGRAFTQAEKFPEALAELT